MFCPQCGEPLPPGSITCQKCGGSQSETLTFFIPKNSKALISYYFGIFSFLLGPLAFLLGIPAICFGIGGVKYAKKHIQAKGAIHAWVGIIAGALSTLISSGVLALIIVSICSNWRLS